MQPTDPDPSRQPLQRRQPAPEAVTARLYHFHWQPRSPLQRLLALLLILLLMAAAFIFSLLLVIGLGLLLALITAIALWKGRSNNRQA